MLRMIVILTLIAVLSSCKTRGEVSATLATSQEESSEQRRLTTVAVDYARWSKDLQRINEAYGSSLSQQLIAPMRRLDGVIAVSDDTPTLTGFIFCSSDIKICDDKRSNLKELVTKGIITNMAVQANYSDNFTLPNAAALPTVYIQELSLNPTKAQDPFLTQLRVAYSTELAQKLLAQGFHMGRSEFAAVAPSHGSQLLTGIMTCASELACDEQRRQLMALPGIQTVAFMAVSMGPVGNKAGGGSGT